MIKKSLITVLLAATLLITVSCEVSEGGIDIAKLVFEILSYIFSTVIGAIGGAKIQRVAIIKDPTNNYNGKKIKNNKEV